LQYFGKKVLSNDLTQVSFIALPLLVSTSLGALIVAAPRGLRGLASQTGMGFASGLMLYVAFVELLAPSLGGGLITVVGFLSGFAAIRVVDVVVPHLHATMQSAASIDEDSARKSLLLFLALVIHNMPEGLAVGSAYIGGGAEVGLETSVAIAVQDFPEGLAAALAILAVSGSISRAILLGMLSGAVEYAASFIPLAVAELTTASSAVFMQAFSASMMIYVVVHEVVPEIFRAESEKATAGFVVGLLLGVLLDMLRL